MRNIKYIMIHCTSTPEGREVSGEEIDKWHRDRGWQMAGYHYLIHLDGTIEHLRPEYMKAAACRVGDANQCGIHVCYVGGIRRKADGSDEYADTRTAAQKTSLRFWITHLKEEYPQAKIVGHRDFDKGKACPCFDVKEYSFIGMM